MIDTKLCECCGELLPLHKFTRYWRKTEEVFTWGRFCNHCNHAKSLQTYKANADKRKAEYKHHLQQPVTTEKGKI